MLCCYKCELKKLYERRKKLEISHSGKCKKIIREKCLKQSAIAKKAGYNIKTFNNMLNGRKIITDVDVINIATAIGAEPNELYGIGSIE